MLCYKLWKAIGVIDIVPIYSAEPKLNFLVIRGTAQGSGSCP